MQPEGDFDIVNDIFMTLKNEIVQGFRSSIIASCSSSCSSEEQLRFASGVKSFLQDKKNLQQKYNRFMRGEYNRDWITSSNNYWKNSRSIFHVACCFGNVEDVQELLSVESNPEGVLSELDECKWSPLHYACRHCSHDQKLIKFLLDKCPRMVLKRDIFDRYPLHIACDSMPSKKVVELLLKHDGRKVISRLTKNLKVRNLNICTLEKYTHIYIILSVSKVTLH